MSLQEQITQKLNTSLNCQHLQVLNESHKHNVPAGSESHFKVVLVSSDFSKLKKVARHQKIYGLLAQEMATQIHALALHTYTPEEWALKQQVPPSPDCLGGEKTSKEKQ